MRSRQWYFVVVQLQVLRFEFENSISCLNVCGIEMIVEMLVFFCIDFSFSKMLHLLQLSIFFLSVFLLDGIGENARGFEVFFYFHYSSEARTLFMYTRLNVHLELFIHS